MKYFNYSLTYLINILSVFVLILLLSVNSYSQEEIQEDVEKEDSSSSKEKNIDIIKERARYESIIEEFKGYLRTIDQSTREEIEEYRKKIVEINNDKKQLYKKLSQEAQQYLINLQDFKERLSLESK